MANLKLFREQKVNEATERWYGMETSELIEELKKLNEQEEFHSTEITLIRALKKALKEIIAERNEEDFFDPDHSADDRLQGICPIDMY